VRVVPRHDDPVHQRRRIRGAPGAGTGDDRDLRDNTRQQDVAVKNIAISGQRVDALLNARAAGVLEGDDGSAVLQREVHRLTHFAGMHLAERPGDDREVLAERRHLAAVDVTSADDHAVRRQILVRHAERRAGMADEGAEFLEGVGLEEVHQSLAGG
jgi:hypothetical protein